MAEKCPCKGDYLDKLVQPAILSVLCEGPAYGLELLRELERRHLADGADVTGFYRSLKKLEADGRLSSVWQTENGERPRRIYTLTESGRRCLKNWRRTLHAYIKGRPAPPPPPSTRPASCTTYDNTRRGISRRVFFAQ